LAELQFAGATATVLIIFGLACLVAYWLRASRKKDPLFSLKIFQIPTFTLGLLGNLFSRIGSSGMPFLIPLLLQLGLNYSPFEAGLTLIPLAISAIAAKRLASPLITRLGYRKFLITNTFLVGVGIASFIWFSPDESQVLRILQLILFGCVNSLQFTAMNSLTLKDLGRDQSSSGNSLFSMVQMLAMSFSVAVCATVLSTFMGHFHTPQNTNGVLQAFHATFLCMGAITCTSVWIFWQLSPEMKSRSRHAVTLGSE
jgi:MFS family permease